MNSSTSLTTLVVGLTLGVSAVAQAPPPAGPPPSPSPAQIGTESPVAQSSRIRASNPGPDGQLRSLYLANGSVVNLPPDLGRSMSAAVRKGERVSVSGLRSNVNGQIVLAASSVTLNGHTFLSQPGPGPIADEERNAAPLPLRPPLGGPNRGRGPRGGPDMARLGPQGPGASGPVTPPPPPPSGPDLARPQGNQPPPPPPPPPDGNRMNAPTPPIDLNAPAQPNTAPAPPAGQPVAPTFTPPIPNGPNR